MCKKECAPGEPVTSCLSGRKMFDSHSHNAHTFTQPQSIIALQSIAQQSFFLFPVPIQNILFRLC